MKEITDQFPALESCFATIAECMDGNVPNDKLAALFASENIQNKKDFDYKQVKVATNIVAYLFDFSVAWTFQMGNLSLLVLIERGKVITNQFVAELILFPDSERPYEDFDWAYSLEELQNRLKQSLTRTEASLNKMEELLMGTSL